MLRKVLISIVDDSQCFREALETLMISMGYDVVGFDCAEEYLASDFVAQTSCLISDWQMHGMSGSDLQDQLLAKGYCIPVIFVTAGCTETERARMLSGGALNVLPKPFDETVLVKCLNKALGALNH